MNRKILEASGGKFPKPQVSKCLKRTILRTEGKWSTFNYLHRKMNLLSWVCKVSFVYLCCVSFYLSKVSSTFGSSQISRIPKRPGLWQALSALTLLSSMTSMCLQFVSHLSTKGLERFWYSLQTKPTKEVHLKIALSLESDTGESKINQRPLWVLNSLLCNIGIRLPPPQRH